MIKYLFLSIFALLILPSLVYASNVNISVTGDSDISVNSTTEGSSTTCINGECTTNEGTSKSTVCINGECTESTGDINIESDNGNTKVNINTSTSNNSSTIKEEKVIEKEIKASSGGEIKEEDKDKKEAEEKSFIEEFFSGLTSVFDTIFSIF